MLSFQGGTSIDTEGEMVVQGSISGGIATGDPGKSITTYTTVTNAPSVDNLTGLGYQIGGSFGALIYDVPVTGGLDFNIIPDPDENQIYYGITENVGFGTPGGEFHVEWGETASWEATRVNVFDIAKGLYIKIMEW